MSTLRAAWPRAMAIAGGAGLAFGLVINAAALYFGIVFFPLIDVTFTQPLATLLALVVGVRLGGWSPLKDLWRFALGIGVASMGLIAYVEILHLTIGITNGEIPPIVSVTFIGAALLLVAGYGIIFGALLRLLMRRLA